MSVVCPETSTSSHRNAKSQYSYNLNMLQHTLIAFWKATVCNSPLGNSKGATNSLKNSWALLIRSFSGTQLWNQNLSCLLSCVCFCVWAFTKNTLNSNCKWASVSSRSSKKTQITLISYKIKFMYNISNVATLINSNLTTHYIFCLHYAYSHVK